MKITRRGKLTGVSAVVLLVLGLAGVACARIGAGAPRRPPVILISIDTLRSDRLPAYGYDKVSTPNLDAFRADSILYKHAYSHCPLTLPSHASMFTGLLPADTGVRDNIGFSLGSDLPTVAELLKSNGYTTGGAISAFVMRKETGIARGFDFYDDEVEPLGKSQVIGRVQRIGGETLAAARRWLDGRTADEPFFLFLHTYDPHSPYTPPEPFASLYKNDPYDGEIAYTDKVIGDLMSYLKAREIYDKALIIILSDHGEGLNDHGEEEHGIFLYREAIQVPLMVKLPRGRHSGATVEAPAALIDVFPTILEHTGTKAPAIKSDAISLTALLRKNAPWRSIYSESYYPKLHFGWSDLHSLTDGKFHYIRAPIPELFDLVNDFGEKQNVLQENRRTYAAMREAIEPYVREAAAPTAIDPDDAAKLAALGYIGSTVAPADGEELPDPKTTIGVFHEIRVAFTHFRDEQLEQCLAICDRLLRDNDRILDLWDLKSKSLAKLGRTDEAILAAKEGLKRQPTTVALLSTVANLSILTGNLLEAEQHAELMMKSEPGQAHEVLARVYAERKDYARAEKEARSAIATGREPTTALMTLGLISRQQDDLKTALSYMNQAIESIAHKRNRRIPNLHLYRGDILARIGRSAEAERDFRREIAMYPTHPDAYSALVLLLAAQGRVAEATKLIYELVEAAPRAPSYAVVSETLRALGDDRGAVYWVQQGLRHFPDDPELRKLAQGGFSPTAGGA
jgi:arylsulfatase A-like enzyme/Flp pilus assembly protein TadD